MSQSDLTFITNEDCKNLLERFRVLIKDTRFFDVLVGYFYTSGFHSLYKSLENTEKIRILIGIGTNKATTDLIHSSNNRSQKSFVFSHAEVKERFSEDISQEMELSEDSKQVEEGVIKFIEWLTSGKLEIKAYPEENLHAKIYLMTFREGDRDIGRVITGSSNFTKSGLVENLEFNVELKNKSDYDFARKKFDELWNNAVDVKNKFLDTIHAKTWLNNTVTPHQLFLKFLYEYFKDEISQSDEVFFKYVPIEFKRLEYQEQAVLNAKKTLEEYGGVFISDVVGLGKTYMSALLANQIDGRSLVLAPPVLLEEDNPGSWPNVFSDFKIAADFESLGKLDQVIKRGVDKYRNIFIDEAHRFRAETNITYEKLAQICRGKRVVLVTATPLNNSPKDILSQIKLFQQSKKSTIPNLPDLENFFSRLEKRLKNLDRQRDHDEYIRVTKENAREIREKVIKYLMVRRTRKEIETYFGKDLKRQGLKFPEVADPEEVFYELNDEEDQIFTKTIELIVRDFKYARYTPLLPEYFKGDKMDQLEIQSQKNMGKFMKILLVKRLESSFFAFKKSIARFIFSYKRFLEEFERGSVYVSKKHTNKVFDLLENDDEELVQQLIDEDKARKFEAKDFSEAFQKDLKNDIEILIKIQKLWEGVKRDPKFLKFVKILSTQEILRKNKLIVFTESKETADYLAKNLKSQIPDGVISFSGQSSAVVREQVISNFDAKVRNPRDDFRILITTEVLAEGVNLHRSNVVINYDIPWNPTRIMQRVGRINRVDTKFNKIHTLNFFPSKQGNDQIKLRESAEAKIHAFIALLGADARLLTEGEDIESHELFNRLVSKKTITGEDEEEESSLKYLQIIRDLRDNDPDLFSQIKRLPKKARTARQDDKYKDSLLTYFRKGKLDKFYLASKNEENRELDFFEAANALEVPYDTKRETLGSGFYDLLEKNKAEFQEATTEEIQELKKAKGGRDSAFQLVKILKAIQKDSRQFTEDQELFLKKVSKQLEEGGLPKQTTKTTLKEINKTLKTSPNPLKLVAVLQKNIPPELLESHFSEHSANTIGPREVILSEYFTGN
ncbi:helicase [Candidatus Nitromaritima sp. SCGC AAA799-A02]|nr:helicase [Candidatus Nitromaritima sp. SCGC AAA799-A02]KMP10890.1 helicase [Candidatus Nitromaritima sp. SCGC AAA799-C22]